MPVSDDRKAARRAQQLVAYNYARSAGLPRGIAKNFSTRAQVDRFLAQPLQPRIHSSYSVSPRVRYGDAVGARLEANPYRYIVRMAYGSDGHVRGHRTVTIVSDRALTLDEVYARAGEEYIDKYQIEVYGYSLLGSEYKAGP